MDGISDKIDEHLFDLFLINSKFERKGIYWGLKADLLFSEFFIEEIMNILEKTFDGDDRILGFGNLGEAAIWFHEADKPRRAVIDGNQWAADIINSFVIEREWSAVFIFFLI